MASKVQYSSRSWALSPLVSYPDPTFSWEKGYWALSWLYRVSNIYSELAKDIVQQVLTLANEIALHHNHLCKIYDCWLGTTKEVLNRHQIFFLVRGWGLDTRLLTSTSPWVPGPRVPGPRVPGSQVPKLGNSLGVVRELLLLTQLQWPGGATLSVRLSVRLSVGHWNFARAAVVLAAGERWIQKTL